MAGLVQRVMVAGLATGLAAGLGGGLVGCAGKKGAAAAQQQQAAPNTGLAALASGAVPSVPVVVPQAEAAKQLTGAQTKPDWTQDKSLDLQRVVQQLESKVAEPGAEAAPAAEGELAAKVVAEPVAEAAKVVTNPEPVEKPKSLDEQIAATSLSLVDLLRRKSVEDPAPLQSYIGLAMLEALQPGAVQQIITAASTSATPLSPDEQRMVESLRGFGQGAHQLAQLASSDGISAAFKRLADMTSGVRASLQMRIRSAALATRVIGFGRFTPVPGNTFLAGGEVRTLVYTEIEHFSYRALSDSEALGLSQQAGSGVDPADRWAVEVSQELQLFDAAGQQVWSLPEQAVQETSRNQRRDFFLVNDVTLPSAMAPGQYTMKIIMRDRSSGVVDESLVTLTLSPDATLAGVGQ